MGVRRRYGQWLYQFQVDGRTYSGTTELKDTERNRSAAVLFEARQRESVQAGQPPVRPASCPFSEAAASFVEWAKGEYRQHPNSWKRLRASMVPLTGKFGRSPVHSITPGDIEDFKASRRLSVREVTIRHDLHALSVMLRYCRKHNWIRGNPMEDIDIPSDADAVRMHALTPAEEAMYFAAAERLAATDRRFWALYHIGRLMIQQGPRPSEVMAARVQDVDLNKREWLIPSGKSRAARRILYLTPESAQILTLRVYGTRREDNGWLFPGRGTGTHAYHTQDGHNRVLDECPGLAFVLYDLRHTAATRWAQAGMDIATLAGILGHANLRTVQRYIHISEEHKKLAMQRFSGLSTEREQESGAERVQ